MESIITLILFTYPGIMADYIHGIIVRGKVYDRKPDEFFRAARDFFISAVLTAVTILPFSRIRGIGYSIQETAKDISGGVGLYTFIGISMMVSAIAAVIWFGLDKITLKTTNKIRKKKYGDTINEVKNVWSSIMKDKWIPYEECVMAVYRDNQLIRAGLTHNVSTDLQEDPGIIMKYTDLAEQQVKLEPGKRTLIDHPVVSYVEPANGIRIDIYDGKKLTDYISDWMKNQKAEFQAEEQESQAKEAEGAEERKKMAV